MVCIYPVSGKFVVSSIEYRVDSVQGLYLFASSLPRFIALCPTLFIRRIRQPAEKADCALRSISSSCLLCVLCGSVFSTAELTKQARSAQSYRLQFFLPIPYSLLPTHLSSLTSVSLSPFPCISPLYPPSPPALSLCRDLASPTRCGKCVLSTCRGRILCGCRW